MARYVPPAILVVEDSPSIRDVVARSLRFAGFEVTEAQHVGEALSLLQALERAPTAVVSDVEMPGLSVLTLIERLRRMRPQVPILLMSGAVHEQRVREMIQRGEVSFLAKPFTWDQLVRSVRAAIAAS